MDVEKLLHILTGQPDCTARIRDMIACTFLQPVPNLQCKPLFGQSCNARNVTLVDVLCTMFSYKYLVSLPALFCTLCLACFF